MSKKQAKNRLRFSTDDGQCLGYGGAAPVNLTVPAHSSYANDTYMLLIVRKKVHHLLSEAHDMMP